MADRRVLAVLSIGRGPKDRCGRCNYLIAPHLPRCKLFGGVLDEDGQGRILRGEQCLKAQQNHAELTRSVL